MAFVATLLGLVGAWEAVLRRHAGATLEFAIQRPQMKVSTSRHTWIVFGNCLVMTGISPLQLSSHLAPDPDRTIFNIAAHEQSPIAYFEYLRRTKQYPQVIIANVSSWIRSTNFEQETELVMQTDPLGLVPAAANPLSANRSYGHINLGSTGEIQTQLENSLAKFVSDRAWSIGHRYHLFDFSLFAWTLATTWNVDNALYQLNIQSWFSVSDSDTDGFGYVGVHIHYRDDWRAGLEQMAERYLKRMRLSRLLTTEYWSRLEHDISEFQSHGTRVYVVRMPEHPQIRDFNNETYELPKRLHELSRQTGVSVLDLSELGPSDGVRLFDSVHPDANSAEVIAAKVGAWLQSTNTSR